MTDVVQRGGAIVINGVTLPDQLAEALKQAMAGNADLAFNTVRDYVRTTAPDQVAEFDAKVSNARQPVPAAGAAVAASVPQPPPQPPQPPQPPAPVPTVAGAAAPQPPAVSGAPQPLTVAAPAAVAAAVAGAPTVPVPVVGAAQPQAPAVAGPDTHEDVVQAMKEVQSAINPASMVKKATFGKLSATKKTPLMNLVRTIVLSDLLGLYNTPPPTGILEESMLGSQEILRFYNENKDYFVELSPIALQWTLTGIPINRTLTPAQASIQNRKDLFNALKDAIGMAYPPYARSVGYTDVRTYGPATVDAAMTMYIHTSTANTEDLRENTTAEPQPTSQTPDAPQLRHTFLHNAFIKKYPVNKTRLLTLYGQEYPALPITAVNTTSLYDAQQVTAGNKEFEQLFEQFTEKRESIDTLISSVGYPTIKAALAACLTKLEKNLVIDPTGDIAGILRGTANSLLPSIKLRAPNTQQNTLAFLDAAEYIMGTKPVVDADRNALAVIIIGQKRPQPLGVTLHSAADWAACSQLITTWFFERTSNSTKRLGMFLYAAAMKISGQAPYANYIEKVCSFSLLAEDIKQYNDDRNAFINNQNLIRGDNPPPPLRINKEHIITLTPSVQCPDIQKERDKLARLKSDMMAARGKYDVAASSSDSKIAEVSSVVETATGELDDLQVYCNTPAIQRQLSEGFQALPAGKFTQVREALIAVLTQYGVAALTTIITGIGNMPALGNVLNDDAFTPHFAIKILCFAVAFETGIPERTTDPKKKQLRAFATWIKNTCYYYFYANDIATNEKNKFTPLKFIGTTGDTSNGFTIIKLDEKKRARDGFKAAIEPSKAAYMNSSTGIVASLGTLDDADAALVLDATQEVEFAKSIIQKIGAEYAKYPDAFKEITDNGTVRDVALHIAATALLNAAQVHRSLTWSLQLTNSMDVQVAGGVAPEENDIVPNDEENKVHKGTARTAVKNNIPVYAAAKSAFEAERNNINSTLSSKASKKYTQASPTYEHYGAVTFAYTLDTGILGWILFNPTEFAKPQTAPGRAEKPVDSPIPEALLIPAKTSERWNTGLEINGSKKHTFIAHKVNSNDVFSPFEWSKFWTPVPADPAAVLYAQTDAYNADDELDLIEQAKAVASERAATRAVGIITRAKGAAQTPIPLLVAATKWATAATAYKTTATNLCKSLSTESTALSKSAQRRSLQEQVTQIEVAKGEFDTLKDTVNAALALVANKYYVGKEHKGGRVSPTPVEMRNEPKYVIHTLAYSPDTGILAYNQLERGNKTPSTIKLDIFGESNTNTENKENNVFTGYWTSIDPTAGRNPGLIMPPGYGVALNNNGADEIGKYQFEANAVTNKGGLIGQFGGARKTRNRAINRKRKTIKLSRKSVF